MTNTTTYSITTSTGRTATRRSEHAYVAASEDWRGNVRWHQTREAARRAAGSTGRVHDVGGQRTATRTEQCFVCQGEGGWDERRAVEGMVYMVCHRCKGTGKQVAR